MPPAERGLTREQRQLLDALHPEGAAVDIRELAKHASLSSSAARAAIRELVKKKLVLRLGPNVFAKVATLVFVPTTKRPFAWGKNTWGQVGDGTTVDRAAPVGLPFNEPIEKIAMGQGHGLAIGVTGAVFAWGRNVAGQLGTGNLQDAHAPVAVPTASPAKAVGAGRNNSVVVKSDGTVWAWGLGGWGCLGSGSPNPSTSPAKVPGLSGFGAVDMGDDHVLALKSDGTVWAWGYNGENQSGPGTTHPQMTPVQVAGVSDAVAVAAAGGHCLALRSDGTVLGWGQNFTGQLGNGSMANAPSPVQPSLPPGVSIVGIAAGAYHSLFLAADGTVWATGDSGFGQLGVASPLWSTVPVKVPGILDARVIGAGDFHSLAVRATGELWSWGWQPAAGSTPAAVAGAPVGVVAATGGWMTSLALAEARARFNPLVVDFGSVQVGGTATELLSFENVGGLPIEVSQVYVVSDTFVSGDITVVSGCAGPIAPGAGCTITVSFKPTQAVSRDEAVRVVSGAGWLLARVTGSGI